jgi:hypothetical protein
MSAYNFGVCFGPNIMKDPILIDENQIQHISMSRIDIISTLISEWNTSEIYPLHYYYLSKDIDFHKTTISFYIFFKILFNK